MNQQIFKVIILPLVLVWFGLSSSVQALSPVPDGGYANGNTAEGTNALFSLTTGVWNTALGAQALNKDTTGNQNTATGYHALFTNTSGSHNTATGAQALFNNDGSDNTANGFQALANNTTGNANTAVGNGALLSNTIGNANAANGADALRRNTTGTDNTAIGTDALVFNTTGSENTALGSGALTENTTGIENTATGLSALFDNTTGNQNTAVGNGALDDNTTGSNNIALGFEAGFNLTTGDHNIDIGNGGVAGESGTIRIGDFNQSTTFIAGIFGTTAGTDAVFVDSNGQLGVGVPSSARFKTEIKPMDKASEAILALKPVTFRYKKEIDSKGMLRFGLVAEEVEKIDPDLVGRDAKGQVSSVRYDAVNAMLLNEFLKEHKTVQELKKEVAALTATVKEQASQIQKVSAQLELQKPSQTVVNNQ